MRVLHAAITRDTDRASRLYQSVGRYLSDPGKLGAFWLEYRAAVIEVAVLGAFLAALWLVRTG